MKPFSRYRHQNVIKWLVLTERVGIGNHVVGPDGNSRDWKPQSCDSVTNTLMRHLNAVSTGKTRNPKRENMQP